MPEESRCTPKTRLPTVPSFFRGKARYMRNLLCLFLSVMVLVALDPPQSTAGDSGLISDLNDDSRVDAEDLMILLSGWRASRAEAEEPIHLFYYYFDDKIELTPSETMIGVGFRTIVSASDRMQFLEDHSSLASFVDAATVNQKIHRLTIENPMSVNRLLRFLDSLAEDSRVEFVTPIFPFQFSDILLDNALNVKFNPEVTDEEIEDLILPNGISILQSGRPAHRHGVFLMAPSEDTLSTYHWRNAVTALFFANLYHENPLTEFASPNLIFTNLFLKG